MRVKDHFPATVHKAVSSGSQNQLLTPLSSLAGGPRKVLAVTVGVDILLYVPQRDPLASLAPDVIRAAVVRQLEQAERVLGEWGKPTNVAALHFKPPGYGHHFTLLRPTPSGEVPPPPTQTLHLSPPTHLAVRVSQHFASPGKRTAPCSILEDILLCHCAFLLTLCVWNMNNTATHLYFHCRKTSEAKVAE